MSDNLIFFLVSILGMAFALLYVATPWRFLEGEETLTKEELVARYPDKAWVARYFVKWTSFFGPQTGLLKREVCPCNLRPQEHAP